MAAHRAFPVFHPVRDILLFFGTQIAFVAMWRLTGGSVTCTTWVAAVSVAVVTAILDVHRRVRAAAGRTAATDPV